MIDEDLGRSAATAEGRPGFQRLMAQVGLDQVGLIVGIEMSRLARSCRDWHQLLEVCALFRTLIADPDGVYDPADYNDRLLLGLKGTMSEAELPILKRRMLEGRRAKARRGELRIRLPAGYIRRPSGEEIKDLARALSTNAEALGGDALDLALGWHVRAMGALADVAEGRAHGLEQPRSCLRARRVRSARWPRWWARGRATPTCETGGFKPPTATCGRATTGFGPTWMRSWGADCTHEAAG